MDKKNEVDRLIISLLKFAIEGDSASAKLAHDVIVEEYPNEAIVRLITLVAQSMISDNGKESALQLLEETTLRMVSE